MIVNVTINGTPVPNTTTTAIRPAFLAVHQTFTAMTEVTVSVPVYWSAPTPQSWWRRIVKALRE